MENTKYVVTLEEDENGELILPIPEQILKDMNWKEGDVLKFADNEDGSFSMTKVETATKRVLVETISMFRIRYVVELPVNAPADWALDTVCMEDAIELSQKHIDEQIISHREVTKDEFIRIFNEDNNYLKDWDEERKLQMVTKINSNGDIVY
jgi:bifunctional DNA-binding transcriptional regulator/antitoxin component of YhaV-PrlF toxin-antitoxin module